MEERRESVAGRRVPTQVRRRKGQDVSGNSRERSEEVSTLGSEPDGDGLRNIIKKLSDEKILRDLHLKHYHMSTAQFKKRTTRLDLLGRFF